MDTKEMGTSDLVREFADIKCEGVRRAFKGERVTSAEHSRLCDVVHELRVRGVLDRGTPAL
jgi:hypothetical protein